MDVYEAHREATHRRLSQDLLDFRNYDRLPTEESVEWRDLVQRLFISQPSSVYVDDESVRAACLIYSGDLDDLWGKVRQTLKEDGAYLAAHDCRRSRLCKGLGDEGTVVPYEGLLALIGMGRLKVLTGLSTPNARRYTLVDRSAEIDGSQPPMFGYFSSAIDKLVNRHAGRNNGQTVFTVPHVRTASSLLDLMRRAQGRTSGPEFDRLTRVKHQVGGETFVLLYQFLLQEHGFERIENDLNWPARSAKVVLRMALETIDRLKLLTDD